EWVPEYRNARLRLAAPGETACVILDYRNAPIVDRRRLCRQKFALQCEAEVALHHPTPRCSRDEISCEAPTRDACRCVSTSNQVQLRCKCRRAGRSFPGRRR